ncbi:MAG TPA: DoxX family protein [Candidatus Polarisedimenticolaceae bacterium]|nr:DoxX family protein [Candidatus Polarisedimenticolaceae bacterium]
MDGIARDLGLLLLRLSGFYLACAHGWGKVVSLATGQGSRFVGGVGEIGFPAPEAFAWAAAAAECVGGVLVGLGALTRVAAAFGVVTMLVAVFLRHHAHTQWLAGIGASRASADQLQSWGSPEMAVLYLLLLAGVMLLGPGRFSLDQLFWDRSGRRRK